MEAESRFRAMGTDVHVVVHGPVELVELAHEQIDDLEQRWSRFLPASEVSELNRRAGTWVHVSPPTVELVSRAIEGWRVTDERFDPTVLGDVVRAGYDRTFDELVDLPEAPTSDLHRDAGGIAVDRVGRRRAAAGRRRVRPRRRGQGPGRRPGGRPHQRRRSSRRPA